MHCTTIYTTIARMNICQKLVPVSAAYMMHSMVVGTSDINCKYGTIFRMPMNNPSTIAIGMSIIRNPMQNNIPTQDAISACPRK